jgi:hypothetical protein
VFFNVNNLSLFMSFRCIVNRVVIQIIKQRPRFIRNGKRNRLRIRIILTVGFGISVDLASRRRGLGEMVILVGAEFAFEAEIGVLEEDASVEEAGAADGEFVEGGPATGRGGGGRGEEIGDDGGNGEGALGFAAGVADEGGEFGGDAGEAGPVTRAVFEFGEDVEDDVVGEG